VEAYTPSREKKRGVRTAGGVGGQQGTVTSRQAGASGDRPAVLTTSGRQCLDTRRAPRRRGALKSHERTSNYFSICCGIIASTSPGRVNESATVLPLPDSWSELIRAAVFGSDFAA